MPPLTRLDYFLKYLLSRVGLLTYYSRVWYRHIQQNPQERAFWFKKPTKHGLIYDAAESGGGIYFWYIVKQMFFIILAPAITLASLLSVLLSVIGFIVYYLSITLF